MDKRGRRDGGEMRWWNLVSVAGFIKAKNLRKNRSDREGTTMHSSTYTLRGCVRKAETQRYESVVHATTCTQGKDSTLRDLGNTDAT